MSRNHLWSGPNTNCWKVLHLFHVSCLSRFALEGLLWALTPTVQSTGFVRTPFCSKEMPTPSRSCLRPPLSCKKYDPRKPHARAYRCALLRSHLDPPFVFVLLNGYSRSCFNRVMSHFLGYILEVGSRCRDKHLANAVTGAFRTTTSGIPVHWRAFQRTRKNTLAL